jgi:hypothetical protein
MLILHPIGMHGADQHIAPIHSTVIVNTTPTGNGTTRFGLNALPIHLPESF